MKKWQIIAQKSQKLIAENQFLLYLGIFFVALFVYLWIQSSPSFLDPDSFYHLKMAELISQRGPILNFPWQQFTVLKDYYVDQHFLYHVIAIPFIKILGDLAGFKFFTVLLATLFILLTYAFFKSEKVKLAEIFALVLLFAPAFMFRISLGKATAFSLILLFSGIYLIFKRRYRLLFLVAFLYVWSYGGFPLLLIAALLYLLSEAIYQTFLNKTFEPKLAGTIKTSRIKKYIFTFLKNLLQRINFKIILVVLGGLIAGFVFNFYFPKNLSFYWQQLVQIGIINYHGIVNVGGEWYPYKIPNLMTDCGVAMILGILSLILFFIFIKKQKTPSIFFGLATLLFFGLTLKSQRYVEYFIPFLVYFIAFNSQVIFDSISVKNFWLELKKDSPRFCIIITIIVICLLAIFPVIMGRDAYVTRQSFKGGISFYRFKGICQYLKTNAPAKAIIMHTDWDNFPELFYYDDQNYYIVGLDPTFMYNYDANKYKLFADITMAKKSDQLYQAIKENFQAQYFVVNSDRLQLAKNLQKDGNFIKVYEDNDGSVYKLK